MISPVCEMIEVKIIVKGNVQMVGFRYWTVRIAKQFGITGYVKNLASGDVEIVATGNTEKINKFIELIKKGPLSADVSEIKIDYNYCLTEEFREFKVRY